jgi:hypothetical protein
MALPITNSLVLSIMKTATAQSSIGINHGYGVLKSSPGFQGG